jgi:hypothetical protein
MRFTGSASVTKAATRYLEPVTVLQAPRKVISMLDLPIKPFNPSVEAAECKTPAVPHPARC